MTDSKAGPSNNQRVSSTRSMIRRKALAISYPKDREPPPAERGDFERQQSQRRDISALAALIGNIMDLLADFGIVEAETPEKKVGSGKQGVAGDVGAIGPVGPPGPTGPTGPSGPCCKPAGSLPVSNHDFGQPALEPWSPSGVLQLPAKVPNRWKRPQDAGERYGFTLPRWATSAGTVLPRSWPGRLHYLWGDDVYPRAYIGDADLVARTSTMRVSTGRFAREPSTGMHAGGPAHETGVMFLNRTGNRVFHYTGSSTAQAASRRALPFALPGVVAGAAYLQYGSMTGAANRGWIAPYDGMPVTVTADRTGGTSGGGFQIVKSDGATETVLGTVLFTTTALTARSLVTLTGYTAGDRIGVKIPAGTTQNDLSVTVEAVDTA